MNLLQTLAMENEPNPFVDDERVYRLKEIIQNLPPNDKTVILLYIEYNSLQKVADLLLVSQSTIFLHVRRIRNEIKEELNKREL